MPRDISSHSALPCAVPERPGLAGLHRRAVAVSFAVGGEQRLLVGQAFFQHDPDCGNVLCITFANPDDGELMLLEQLWTGEIEAAAPAGCDYLIRLA